jgi:cyclophilin family peptidyl-prolyl cis-trans isomerase
MARTPNRRQREAARDRERATAEARRASARRRRQLVGAGVVVLVLLGLLGAYLGSRDDDDSATSSSTTTSVPTASTADASLPPTGVAPTPAPMGESLEGPTPCPAADGSSPRVTLFAEAPGTCIDPTSFYIATISTTVGEMTVQLNPRRAPETVNAFVVLAGYHFYDGQPVTSVSELASFTIGLEFTGPGADEAPGFTIPDEVPEGGQVFTPGTLAMSGTSGTPGTNRGQLLVATYERAAGIDQGVTGFGIMLSGDEVLKAIDSLASQDGLPTEPVTITSLRVVRSSPIPD